MNEKPSVRTQQDALRKRAAGQHALYSNWRFFKYSMPFFLMIGGGAFVLYYAQKIRIEFRQVKSEMDRSDALKEELQNKGVGVKQKRPLVELLKDLDKLNVDNWENIRGPRPYEDNKEYIQSREKKRQEAEAKKNCAEKKSLSEPLQKSS